MDIRDVIERHQRSVWAVCYRLTGDAHEAQDLAQETFVRAALHPPADLDAPLGPWLHRVARNLALDWLRHEKHVEAHVREVLHAESANTPACSDRVSDLADSAHGVLLRQLAGMTATERMVWICRELLDYSVEEAATALGTSPGNVKTLLGRARQRTISQVPAPARVSEALSQVVAWSLSLGQGDGDEGPVGDRSGARDSLLALLDLVVDAARRHDPAALPGALIARARLRLLHDRRSTLSDLREAVALSETDDTLRGRALRELARVLPRSDPERLGLLREARALAHTTGDLATEVDSTSSLVSWLSELGQRAEARALLEALDQLVVEAVGRQPSRSRAALLGSRGVVLLHDSAYAESLDTFREGEGIGEALSDAAMQGSALANQGIALRGLGRLEEARAAFEGSAAIARRAGLPALQIANALNIGLVEQGLGNLGAAAVALTRTIDLAREQRDDKGLSLALFNLGVVEHQRGRPQQAETRLVEALSVVRSGGFRMIEAGALAHLGAARAALGAPEAARRDLVAARALAEQQGWPAFVALCDVLDGFVQPEIAEARLQTADPEAFVELRAAADLLSVWLRRAAG